MVHAHLCQTKKLTSQRQAVHFFIEQLICDAKVKYDSKVNCKFLKFPIYQNLMLESLLSKKLQVPYTKDQAVIEQLSIPFNRLPWCKCSLRINFNTLCSSNAACTLKHFKLNSTQQAKQVKAGYLAVLSSSKVHFMHFTRNFACKNITNSCLVIPFSCLWPITIGRKSLKKMANKGCAESSQIVTILTYIYTLLTRRTI